MITVYADGSAYLADQSGGWAWWVNDTFWDAGYQLGGTNNQMEMTAVWRGLLAVQAHGDEVMVVSDSAYVINCFVQRWYVKWRANETLDGRWKSSSGKGDVANKDLWVQMIDLVENYPAPIIWKHCRGHNRGGPEDAPYVDGNDKVDKLAGAARKNKFPGRPLVHGDASTAAMRAALGKKRRVDHRRTA